MFRIYERLSQAGGLLPPAIGFLFDREERSEQDCKDLQRESRGEVDFLPRRMFENYLLNADALAAVVSGIAGFREGEVTSDEVANWLTERRGETTEEEWVVEADGARLLQSLFSELSETRVNYDKVEYGLALTKWLVANRPDHLKELADLLVRTLDRATERQSI